MGRKSLGNVQITRRISPAYQAMLEQLEAAGFDLEAVIASAHSLIWSAATVTGYDPFDYQVEDRFGMYAQMHALMAKELYGDTWTQGYRSYPESSYRPFDEVYMDRIRRNLDKHRAYQTYLHAKEKDREDEATSGEGGGGGKA